VIGHLTALEPSGWKLLGRLPIKISAFALKNDEIGIAFSINLSGISYFVGPRIKEGRTRAMTQDVKFGRPLKLTKPQREEA
jgi:hypothetical protein